VVVFEFHLEQDPEPKPPMAHLFLSKSLGKLSFFVTITGNGRSLRIKPPAHVFAHTGWGMLPKVLRSVARYVVSMAFTRVGGAQQNANQNQLVSKVV
jgi:hypothetical protein